MNLLKQTIWKIKDMAKNMSRKGKSARNGNAPAPYTKYEKQPHRYSAQYYEWKKKHTAGRKATQYEARV